VPLAKIKEIGRAIKSATINDVLISTVTGAMRSYLKTRNVPVNELDLRVTVPFNISNRAPSLSWATSSASSFCPCRYTSKTPS